jgi:hypothetical protein
MLFLWPTATKRAGTLVGKGLGQATDSNSEACRGRRMSHCAFHNSGFDSAVPVDRLLLFQPCEYSFHMHFQ